MVSTIASGLRSYESFVIDADLIGATGGTLDLYLQRQVAPGVWRDWVRFPQLAAGASAIRYTQNITWNTLQAQTAVGQWNAAATSGTQTLTSGSQIEGHPGDAVRLVAVSGSGTSAGAAVTVYVTAYKQMAEGGDGQSGP